MTTKSTLTPELIQMILSLVDVGMKHPELGGARLAMQGATVLQWLQSEQNKLNTPVVNDDDKDEADAGVATPDLATDLEEKS